MATNILILTHTQRLALIWLKVCRSLFARVPLKQVKRVIAKNLHFHTHKQVDDFITDRVNDQRKAQRSLNNIGDLRAIDICSWLQCSQRNTFLFKNSIQMIKLKLLYQCFNSLNIKIIQ